MKRIFVSGLIVVVFLSFSCTHKKNDVLKNVDVSKIELRVKIERMDFDVFEKTLDSSDVRVRKLMKNYGKFFNIYCNNVMRLGNPNSEKFNCSFASFAKNAELKEVYVSVKNKFPDLNFLENELTFAFRHYKYYFPSKLVPKFVSCISGFNNQVIVCDSTLAVCPDMYLGRDCKYYPLLELPTYKTKKFTPDYMGVDCIRGWVVSEFPDSSLTNDLLSNMIYQGKIMYLIDALMPEKEDSIKMGYSAKDMKWCERNLANVWAFFIEKKLLYSPDQNQIRLYIEDGPFTGSISKEAPARIAVWFGWQIVQRYMTENPSISITQLMHEKDSRKILMQSKFKPK